MQIRCAVAYSHLILPTTWSAWFRLKPLLKTLSSPLDGRQTPWFSSWSSCKSTIHLFHRPSCSHRILTSCAGCMSPTSPLGCSSTWNHKQSWWGSPLRNNWSSVRRKVWAVQWQQPNDWKLATGTSSRSNSVARIPPMTLLLALGILRSYLQYWYMYSTSGNLYIGRCSFLTQKHFWLGDRSPWWWIFLSSWRTLRGIFSVIGTCSRLHLLRNIWLLGQYNCSASSISGLLKPFLASCRRYNHPIRRTSTPL